jgi:hypothetical protein
VFGHGIYGHWVGNASFKGGGDCHVTLQCGYGRATTGLELGFWLWEKNLDLECPVKSKSIKSPLSERGRRRTPQPTMFYPHRSQSYQGRGRPLQVCQPGPTQGQGYIPRHDNVHYPSRRGVAQQYAPFIVRQERPSHYPQRSTSQQPRRKSKPRTRTSNSVSLSHVNRAIEECKSNI